MTMTRVCGVADLPPGSSRRVMACEPIAVFNDEGTLYAISDRCPHGNASLADGYVEAGEVECPLHASMFDLKTGAVLCRPATESVQAYSVVVQGDDIFVEHD